jgi:hypothetical protein
MVGLCHLRDVKHTDQATERQLKDERCHFEDLDPRKAAPPRETVYKESECSERHVGES